jgi:hypothetical protein
VDSRLKPWFVQAACLYLCHVGRHQAQLELKHCLPHPKTARRRSEASECARARPHPLRRSRQRGRPLAHRVRPAALPPLLRSLHRRVVLRSSAAHGLDAGQHQLATRRGRCASPRRPARWGCRGPRDRGARLGHPAEGVSWPPTRPRARSTIHLSTRMFSPKPGQRNLPSLSLRNQFTKKIFGGFVMLRLHREPVLEVVAHVVAAEGQHRERVAAHDADLARGRGGGLRAHRGAEEDPVRPVEGLDHQGHGGGAAAAEDDRRDRHALRVVPTNLARARGCSPSGAVKRELGCAAFSIEPGLPRVALPVGELLGDLGPSLPSHHTSPSAVIATLVKMRVSCAFIALGLTSCSCPARRRSSPPRG